MKSFEKLLKVLAKNIGTTLVLIAAIILFAIFSDGLLAGIITAFSAMIVYACCSMLYKEFKQKPANKKK